MSQDIICTITQAQPIRAELKAGVPGMGIPPGGSTGQIYAKQSNADYDGAWRDYDHGALTGLADDDHTQYYNQARGDARYSQLSHNHDSAYAPLSHNHAGVYAPISHTHAAADITPAGSPSYIQYNNAGALGGSPNFTWDYANNELYVNGKIGVGTLNPGAKISLANYYSTYNNATSVLLYESGSDKVGFGISSHLLEIHADTTSGNIGFFTAGTEKARITDTGRLGIGTNTPSAIAHIRNADATDILRLDDGSNNILKVIDGGFIGWSPSGSAYAVSSRGINLAHNADITAGAFYGLYSAFNALPSANTSNNLYGNYFTINTIAGNAYTIGGLTGTTNRVAHNAANTLPLADAHVNVIYNNTTGTITKAGGIYNLIYNTNNGGGTISAAYGVNNLIMPGTGGTISAAYGVYNSIAAATGTLTAAYGLYNAVFTNAVTAYGIYDAGNKIYFGGDVQINGITRYGGTTSAYPALKQSGTILQARLADDSGFANVEASLFRANAAFVAVEQASNYSPANGTEAYAYMKGDKFIIAYNHGGTVKYRYLDLTSTDATWTYTTTAP